MRDFEILCHTLGFDSKGGGRCYRNHFVAGPGHDDYPVLMKCVEAGLMTRRDGSCLTGGDFLFMATDAGRAYVADNRPPPEKLTRSQKRYRKFLEIDSGLSFGELLKRGML